MAEVKYVLRDLPGVAELEDLLRRINAEKNPEWTPLADGFDEKVVALSRKLFGITDQDVEEPPAGLWNDVDEMVRWERWRTNFVGPGGEDVDLTQLGWDVNDAAGEELELAGHFYFQIVAVSKGLLGRLPDAPRSDAEIARNTQDWARSLQAEADKFRRKK